MEVRCRDFDSKVKDVEVHMIYKNGKLTLDFLVHVHPEQPY